ncbi:flagellar biosynthetic protein FliO [Gracilibacillus kekensis]|uniref:Flagellar protein FliO/FliZ n=1 Tax=Gracilibacillus kekensis TaxID=1027249 RepID=A0A1M7PGY9_9BACI|nr:flagellar biosynthetic protein FliO [Gracilibacillus kekensis]SHN16329.1 flagellar protein FliO/FliZ [Gracilibacillus kekensis]
MVSITRKLIFFLVTVTFLFFQLPSAVTYATVEDMYKKPAENQGEQQGETDENSGEEPVVDSPNLFFSFLQLLIALALVIGLIIFISKFLQKKNGFLKRHKVIENYGGITVGSNKSIQTIKIGDRFYVIGVADNIELLMEITDNNTIEQLLSQEENTNDSISKIKEKITKSTSYSQDQNKNNFEKLFSKELHTMKEGRKNVYKKLRERKQDYDD